MKTAFALAKVEGGEGGAEFEQTSPQKFKFHLILFHLISFLLFYLHLISSFLVLSFTSHRISSHFIPFCLVSFLPIGIRIDRAMVRSLPVRSLQPKVRSRHSKVRSLHQISYFANNIRYFAPCCNVKYYFPVIFKVL